MVSIPFVLELAIAEQTAVPVIGLVVADTGVPGVIFWILGGALVLIIAILIWRR